MGYISLFENFYFIDEERTFLGLARKVKSAPEKKKREFRIAKLATILAFVSGI